MTAAAAYWQVAQRVCTTAELRVLELRDRHGLSTRAISLALGLSRWAVRDRLDSADRKIAAAMTPDPEEAQA